MSTDDQPNSLETQRDGIQRYATVHGFEVAVTYDDPGKSGLEIRNRPGLRRLLRDVISENCWFKAILVYDVSRWGRFQDTDESAHYEFICRRAGIPVHYCAEQFENDAKLPNAIMKTLKRTMAAEYSRELSVKISAAHKRMAAEGYHVGGVAGYGLRRMLIKANGREEVLETGECKNLISDHVVDSARKTNCSDTLGIRLSVFFPQQLQGQMAMLLELLVNRSPVRLRTLPRSSGLDGLVPEQLGFQFLFAQALRQRPTDPGRSRPFQIVVNRTQPHSATARNLALPQSHSNRNRRTSFVFRMDFLLAGTLFSLLFMEFQCRVIVQRGCRSCCSSVENIPLQAERQFR
jgi:DNA invertase Pin-like site-specific DNA recombinase